MTDLASGTNSSKGPQLFRSERGRSDGFPAKALEELGNLAIVHRRKGAPQAPRLLEHPARPTRRVEEQRPPGFGSGVLPCMRDAARYEGTGPGSADCELVVDLEGELSAQNIDQLVAAVVEVKRRIGAWRRGSSNAITLSAVSAFCSLSAADRPGDIFHTAP